MPRSSQRRTPEETRALYVALQEARSRGLPVDPKILSGKQTRWPVDSNGYLVKNDGKQYNPTEAQAKFIASKAYFSSFHGSRGCGKTSSGAQKALQKIREGQNGIIINPDFENLKISTWPEFREWIPWEMVVSGQRYRRELDFDPHQPFILPFTNGVRVIIKGVKDPDSARGPNVNWLWYDESQRDNDGRSFRTAAASVRVGKDPQTWVTWTPNGYDHWTYEFFIEKKIPEEVAKILIDIGYEGELIEDFFGSMLDNKENLDPAFMASMMTLYTIEWERQQEIFGQFVKKAGALGNRAWFDGKIIDKLPDAIPEKRVRYWDLAATEKKLIGPAQKKINDPDESVGTLMNYYLPVSQKEGEKDEDYTAGLMDKRHKYEFIIEHQHGGFWEYNNLLDNIYQTAVKDGPFIKIILEEEPGSGGKNQVVAIKNFLIQEKGLVGWSIEGWKPEGDRVSLANYWFSECKPPENDDQLSVCGLIYLLKGEWVEPFLRQLSSFGVGKHDDKITSISGARLNLAPIRKWSKVGFLHL